MAILKNNWKVSINSLNICDYVTHQLNLQNLHWASCGASRDKVSHFGQSLCLITKERSGQKTRGNCLRTLKLAKGQNLKDDSYGVSFQSFVTLFSCTFHPRVAPIQNRAAEAGSKTSKRNPFSWTENCKKKLL